MSDPIVDPADLAMLLNDDSLNEDRAAYLIGRAQTLCEVVAGSPLPAGAEVIVERVAARAYGTTTSARQYQLDMADAEYGTQEGAVGGVYLTESDRIDLLEMVSRARDGASGRVFSVDILPVGYVAPRSTAALDSGFDVFS